MQGTKSNNLCEAPREMSIRDKRRMYPRGSANLWSNMVNPRWFEDESVQETSLRDSISKRRYGIQTEGNLKRMVSGMKSRWVLCECL